MRKVTIIGAGRIGGAMAIALDRARYPVDAIVYRGGRYVDTLRSALSGPTRFLSEPELHSVDSEVLIIASADSEIRTIAERASDLEHLPKVALHTSGSLSSAELSPLNGKGVRTASLHPLAAVSDPLSGPDRFRGAYFCVEGEREAADTARRIAEHLGGQPFSIASGSKALYHAAAVMSAGHVVALLDAAIEMLSLCGLTPEEARSVLLPLARGSLANLGESGPATALTGPYARGDGAALDRHLAAMTGAAISADLRNIYLDLAARSVGMLINDGRDLTALRDRIQIAKRDSE